MTRSLAFGLLGKPVGHSKSPKMHRAAYAALGLPHTYEAFEVDDAEVEREIEALRRGELAGLNVTVPHKLRVLSFVDEVDASAAQVGAANTLVRVRDGVVRAYNTDVPALARELERLRGGAKSSFEGRTGLVLGTGGASRAAIVALSMHLGMSRVVVRGRSFDDADRAADFVRDMQEAFARAEPAAGASSATSRIELVAEPLVAPVREDPRLAALVQATSCGMKGAASGDVVANAVAWESVPKDAVALDVVYTDAPTPFLERAAAHGLAHDHGLGMLARQGALAFERWLGVPAPFDVMLAAIS